MDLHPQPRYPYSFVQADAVEFIREQGAGFDFIHTSPPCQHDSVTGVLNDNVHPDLIAPTRAALLAIGQPGVIENVSGAVSKLRAPAMLCGTMFGLRTYRHRYFEPVGWGLRQQEHLEHTARQVKMGRAPRAGEFIQAVGNFSGVQLVREDWGVHWMNRDGIREAIPPAYTEWVGTEFLKWSEQHG